MSKASFEIAGIKFADVDIGGYGISTVKYPSQEEVAAYERGRAAGRVECVAELRALADRARRLASKSPPGASRDAWRGEAVTMEGAAIEMEAKP